MKKKNNNKKIILIFTSIVLTISLIFVITNVKENKEIVFYVNDEPVHEEELLNSAKNLSGAVRNELIRTYKIKSEEFSWDKDIEEGKKAIEYLKEEAVNKSTYEKVSQIKAKENDLINKIDYKFIKKEFEEENRKRRDDKNNNKVVYGTTHFEFSEYYQYMNSNLTIQLRKKLIDDGTLNITDKEIKLVYENNKDMFQSENEETGEREIIPFETVKSSVMDVGLNEKFNQYMNQEVEIASVKIKDEGRLNDLLEEELG